MHLNGKKKQKPSNQPLINSEIARINAIYELLNQKRKIFSRSVDGAVVHCHVTVMKVPRENKI